MKEWLWLLVCMRVCVCVYMWMCMRMSVFLWCWVEKTKREMRKSRLSVKPFWCACVCVCMCVWVTVCVCVCACMFDKVCEREKFEREGVDRKRDRDYRLYECVCRSWQIEYYNKISQWYIDGKGLRITKIIFFVWCTIFVILFSFKLCLCVKQRRKLLVIWILYLIEFDCYQCSVSFDLSFGMLSIYFVSFWYGHLCIIVFLLLHSLMLLLWCHSVV